MTRFLLRLSGTLLLCLALGLGGLPAVALNGPQMAEQLNQAYDSTPAQCVGNHAAYYCSGVMFKQVLPGDPLPFWSHGPDAIARGAERFDYLRRDVLPNGPQMDNGYVFADRFTAIGQNKDYQLQGDDGMSRPPELLVRNWGATPPTALPVQALVHRRTVAGLKAALRDQRTWFEATGEWLPVLRLASDGGSGQRFGFDKREQMYNGYQVASRLNARFDDTASTCRDGKSALHCNGVIIRATGYGDFKSWNPSDNSNSRDGVSFSVVRKDIGTLNVVGTEGLIFHELGRPMGHQVRFRCLYPANAGTSGIPNSCRATCASENITTVAAWRSKYGSSPGQSCTFMDTPAEVQLNTDVRQGQTWATAHNELIIGAWPPDIPTQLPIEAFFYQADSGLVGARYIQNDFLQVTGIFVPIMKVQLGAASGSKFVFRLEDQGY
ncbi:MAG TPA: hypothetical protein DIT18_17655 [Pseudomonas sp.]|nr:hypothetical protein [Pseudomonas sp.]